MNRLVFILNSDRLGSGDDSLGERIMASFIDTLSNVEVTPGTIIFYNGAVRLLRPGTPWLDALKRLEEYGADLLACVTCLEHFGLLENLAVGRVSNMREIVLTMVAADRTVTV